MSARTVCLLILVVIFSSCEKKVSLTLPAEESKPVLNLLLNKDSMIMARVSLSGYINENQVIPDVTNAEVNLYENGAFKEKLLPVKYAGYTYYKGHTLAQTGATYRVTAAVSGFKEAAGTDQVPDSVQIEEMKMNRGDEEVVINLQLHDDPGVQNYYRVRLLSTYIQQSAPGITKRSRYQLAFETADATLDLFNDKSRFEFYTTDALFNGRSPRFAFKATYYKNSNSGLAIEVTSLTYNSYNYLNSVYMASEKNGDALAEKVAVFNNIENGLGIVGGMAQREYVLINYRP
jgi:hypothetical protein